MVGDMGATTLRGFSFRSLLAAALAGMCVAACGSPSAGSGASPGAAGGGRGTSGTPGRSRAPVSGTANVAYAGSLAKLDEKRVGPAFAKATGYAYQGRGSGALALSKEIASGEITPNVFESVGGGPIKSLEPRFTRWYVRFAASPIVVAYNPSSPHASELKAIAAGRRPLADLFRLMAQPGFRLGRTDPNTDPQGAAFIQMLQLAQSTLHLPAGTVRTILGGPPSSATSPQIFAETALEPRLQAGQLDAASAYRSQAVQLHLPYISLPASINLGDPALAAHYATARVTLADGTVATGKPLTVTITVIGTTDRKAADAFVAYVLSPAGLAMHKKGGYTLLSPTAFGDKALIPAAVRRELGG